MSVFVTCQSLPRNSLPEAQPILQHGQARFEYCQSIRDVWPSEIFLVCAPAVTYQVLACPAGQEIWLADSFELDRGRQRSEGVAQITLSIFHRANLNSLATTVSHHYWNTP